RHRGGAHPHRVDPLLLPRRPPPSRGPLGSRPREAPTARRSPPHQGAHVRRDRRGGGGVTPPRDGNRDLRSDELDNTRADLKGRTPEQVKADERRAKNAAARDSALRSGGDDGDRRSIFDVIFGKEKK